MGNRQRMGVFGLGMTGISVLSHLNSLPFDVVAWDDRGSAVCSAKQKFDKVDFADIDQWEDLDAIIISPGIPFLKPKEHRVVKYARDRGIKILSDMDIFFEKERGSVFVGITGTNGKSTTCTLVKEILVHAGKKTALCGNIGHPVLDLSSLDTRRYLCGRAILCTA